MFTDNPVFSIELSSNLCIKIDVKLGRNHRLPKDTKHVSWKCQRSTNASEWI
jgi:hypothetical protein